VVKAAVWVPDATMDAMRLPLRFFATARRNGAELRPFTEVTGLLGHGRRVSGVAVRDHLTGVDAEVHADLVVNATGPWCERLARMAGTQVPVRPSPGVLLALRGRLCNLVVNRLHPAGDGDIVLPQRSLSVVGTSAWVVEDPDDLDVPEEHVRAMYREGARLVPAVAAATERAAWSAARPLVGAAGGASSGRELSRTFKCFDHAATDGVEGFVTITGGKATTLRAMAESAADVVCAKLGVPAPCRTREVVLEPHSAYYTGGRAA
jgi:glycerol-3-phosphate dehydrogenase